MMCLAQYVDCVQKKAESVCACDYVPEKPDVYDFKDMLY